MADMNKATQIDGDWMMKNYPSMDPTHPKWQKTIDSEQAKMNLAFKSKNSTTPVAPKAPAESKMKTAIKTQAGRRNSSEDMLRDYEKKGSNSAYGSYDQLKTAGLGLGSLFD